ncbi:unnamed protein product [Clavelina lepadiformis]|uniref:Uncharacterized protein n=1 Tax=Clavelina lepadiformis TaxID=159417 RepID=A0ABP0FC33_CLALP
MQSPLLHSARVFQMFYFCRTSVAIELPGDLSSIQPGLDRSADQLSVSLLDNPLANQRRKLQKPYNYTTALPMSIVAAYHSQVSSPQASYFENVDLLAKSLTA